MVTNKVPPYRAVLMGIKQLNLDINLKSLDFQNQEHLSPAFLKINPSHTIPAIVDGDFSLGESRAILQYLFNKYAPDSSLYPTNPKKRAIVDRSLNFDMSYFGSIKDVLLSYRDGVDPSEQQITSLKNNLKLWDTLIGDNKYITGNELTIADLSVLASTTVLVFNDFHYFDDLPNFKAWFDRIREELPYYQEVNGGIDDFFRQMVKKQ